MEFVFYMNAVLSKRYKNSIIRKLKGSEKFSDITRSVKKVIIGDWTLYRGDNKDTSPQYILSRDTVKSLLGVKKLKAW